MDFDRESYSFYPSPSPLGDDAEVSDAGQTPTGGRWGGTLSYSGWDNGFKLSSGSDLQMK